MIKELVERWHNGGEKKFFNDAKEWAYNDSSPYYDELVNSVIKSIETDDYEDYSLDPMKIHVIDDGDYQGTRLYVIAEKGYQPSTYYTVFVDYGSCSGCDALEHVNYMDDKKQKVKDYMLMGLHILQSIKQIGRTDDH